jgi:hypothetical protein
MRGSPPESVAWGECVAKPTAITGFVGQNPDSWGKRLSWGKVVGKLEPCRHFRPHQGFLSLAFCSPVLASLLSGNSLRASSYALVASAHFFPCRPLLPSIIFWL